MLRHAAGTLDDFDRLAEGSVGTGRWCRGDGVGGDGEQRGRPPGIARMRATISSDTLRAGRSPGGKLVGGGAPAPRDAVT
jgi:hypothetical protein